MSALTVILGVLVLVISYSLCHSSTHYYVSCLDTQIEHTTILNLMSSHAMVVVRNTRVYTKSYRVDGVWKIKNTAMIKIEKTTNDGCFVIKGDDDGVRKMQYLHVAPSELRDLQKQLNEMFSFKVGEELDKEMLGKPKIEKLERWYGFGLDDYRILRDKINEIIARLNQ